MKAQSKHFWSEPCASAQKCYATACVQKNKNPCRIYRAGHFCYISKLLAPPRVEILHEAKFTRNHGAFSRFAEGLWSAKRCAQKLWQSVGDNGTSLIEIMVSLQKLRLNILRSNLNRNHESPWLCEIDWCFHCLHWFFEYHPQISFCLERKMPLKPARLFAFFCNFFSQRKKVGLAFRKPQAFVLTFL